jgi:hypothetical protein
VHVPGSIHYCTSPAMFAQFVCNHVVPAYPAWPCLTHACAPSLCVMCSCCYLRLRVYVTRWQPSPPSSTLQCPHHTRAAHCQQTEQPAQVTHQTPKPLVPLSVCAVTLMQKPVCDWPSLFATCLRHIKDRNASVFVGIELGSVMWYLCHLAYCCSTVLCVCLVHRMENRVPWSDQYPGRPLVSPVAHTEIFGWNLSRQ